MQLNHVELFPSVEAMQLSTIGNLLGPSRKNLGAAITLSGLDGSGSACETSASFSGGTGNAWSKSRNESAFGARKLCRKTLLKHGSPASRMGCVSKDEKPGVYDCFWAVNKRVCW